MTIPLLPTKFHQPAPPAPHVPRPQLREKLDEGLAFGRRLTLVSAPAGFGKTTCVSAWLEGYGRTVAWLALEPADDEPVRFFTYLIAALQRAAPQVGRTLAEALHAGQLPPADLLTVYLIHDLLTVEGDLILVLDDFHVLQDQAILQVMDGLLANLPNGCHLVLVTREDPPLPLARLRASGQLTEIRAGDLRFDRGEAGRYFNDILGMALSDADLEALENRTEGWPAGLQLAGLSMRSRQDRADFIASLSGSHRYILGYLTEEVLNQQPEAVQDFLLQTSILDQLNGELCDAVTLRTDSRTLLEKLLSANLFLIPLDDEQRWYRYHHLFADLLRSQQQRTRPEQTRQLHRSASLWYRQAGFAREAIEHALAAQDYGLAVSLIETYAMPMITQGYARTVEAWVEAIPAEWHVHSPRASLAFGWNHLLRGNYARVPRYLAQAETAIDAAGLNQEQTRRMQAERYTLYANLLHVQGRAEESLQHAEQALELSDADHYLEGLAQLGLGGAYRQLGDYARARGAYLKAIQESRLAENRVPELLAVSALTLMAVQHGQLRFAEQVAGEAVAHYARTGSQPPILGAVYGALGLVAYEWNQLDQARELFERSLQLGQLGGHNPSLIYTLIAESRLFQALADLDAAHETLQEAVDLVQAGAPTWLVPDVAAQQVRLHLAEDHPAAAAAVLEGYAATQPQGALQHELITLAKLRLALYRAQVQGQQDSLPEALGQAEQLIAAAAENQRDGIGLQARLLSAQLHAAAGEGKRAGEDLDQALALAESEGYRRSFLDEGPGLLVLLKQATARGPQAEYARQLVQAAGAATPRSRQATDREHLVEPLTERELEVLALMAQGLKYQEISDRLFITLNTVRFHVKGIYGKLGVNNRTHAIEAARQLGLLND
ncbi:MAG: LuxR C-terminal-related transcriptional regulator [Anaerolineales bacterium]